MRDTHSPDARGRAPAEMRNAVRRAQVAWLLNGCIPLTIAAHLMQLGVNVDALENELSHRTV